MVPPRPAEASAAQALLVDLFVALIFPLQHTVWTQPPVKRAMIRLLGGHFERPAYVISSALALAATVWLWRTVDDPVYSLPAWTLWPFRVLFVAAVAMQTSSAMFLGSRMLTGKEHLIAYLERRPPPVEKFHQRGIYRRIRHPAALFQIIQLWCAPVLHADRLLIAALWSLWIIIATVLEEKRLVAAFGDAYLEYRRQTGFLWPRRSRG